MKKLLNFRPILFIALSLCCGICTTYFLVNKSIIWAIVFSVSFLLSLIFFLVFFVIAAVGIVVGQLNTTFIIDSIGLLKSHSNVIYFFVIFTPLYFGYFNFTWYAFFKTLAKYRK